MGVKFLVPSFFYDKKSDRLAFGRHVPRFFADEVKRQDVVFTSRWGGSFSIDSNVYAPTYLVKAGKHFVRYSQNGVGFLDYAPDRSYKIVNGSRSWDFDSFEELLDGYSFSTHMDYTGPDDVCYGNLEVSIYPSDRLAEVSFGGTCRVNDFELESYVIRDLEVECSKQSNLEGKELYTCRVFFRPVRNDPESACRHLSYTDYFKVNSCKVKGREVELSLIFPASELDEIDSYSGLVLDPDEYVEYSIVDEFVSAQVVEDYLRDYFKDFGVSVIYIESSDYPFELFADVSISEDMIPFPDLPKYLDKFF